MNKKLKTYKGITLIALIITIIILLILAGVTIAQLTESGLFGKTNQAKQEHKIAQAKEHLNLKISEVQVEKNGEATLKDFDESLKNDDNYEYQISLIDETEMYVIYDGVEFKVDSNLKMEYVGIRTPDLSGGNTNKKPTIDDSVPKINYYGKIVDYKSNIDNTLVWKVFYIDDESVYLISETTTGTPPITGFNINAQLSDYSNGSDVSEVGRKLNSALIKSEKFFVQSNAYSNIKATAYLTDTTKWEEYLDLENINGAYAIGSPTLELFIKSYNETHSEQVFAIVEKYGYKYSDKKIIPDDTYSGIYSITGGDRILLASPWNSDAHGGKIMPIIPSSSGSGGHYMGLHWTGGDVDLKPVVSIPRNRFCYDFKN